MVITELTGEQCREVLARKNVGRLACARDDQPYIVPVFLYFGAEDDALYSFSTLGQKIEWMRSNPKICVEVEDIVDPFNWTTVIVFGRYEELDGSSEEDALRRAHELFQKRPEWWLPGSVHLSGAELRQFPLVFRLCIDRISGRHASRAE